MPELGFEAMMKVILQQDVVKLGKEGDIVNVADGYFRNYLFPRKLAIEAVGGALKMLQVRQARELQRTAELRTQADQLAENLVGKTVTILARAGSGERLYGSITSSDIAEAVQKDLGITLDRRKIHLNDPIKAMGTYEVPVKLHRDLTVPISVEVSRAQA